MESRREIERKCKLKLCEVGGSEGLKREQNARVETLDLRMDKSIPDHLGAACLEN